MDSTEENVFLHYSLVVSLPEHGVLMDGGGNPRGVG